MPPKGAQGLPSGGLRSHVTSFLYPFLHSTMIFKSFFNMSQGPVLKSRDTEVKNKATKATKAWAFLLSSSQ